MPRSAALPHLHTRRGNNEIRDSNVTKLEVVVWGNPYYSALIVRIFSYSLLLTQKQLIPIRYRILSRLHNSDTCLWFALQAEPPLARRELEYSRLHCRIHPSA